MAFRQELDRRQPDPVGRTWVYVPYDQLSDQLGPLAALPPEQVGIVLVESLAKGRRRAYHPQKLALVLANQRQFALEQAARGVAVDHRAVQGTFADGLRQVVAERGPLRLMRPAERELRVELAPLVASGGLIEQPHDGWLTTRADFEALGPAPWRMDAFYRQVRRRTGILMDDGKPVGGRFSLDGDNRKPWKGSPEAPSPPTFSPDAITLEVVDLVRRTFGDHPGTLDPATLPTTLDDAEAAWAWALSSCLESFGPYEDAMSTHSRGLFHTRVAPLLNLHRLLPARVVADVLASDAPLNSVEGFVRQVLGWREFVRHVHEATDGLRTLDGRDLVDPLGRTNPLPPAFWPGAPSGLRCLDDVVEAVWDEGWTHHIPRLMVLANLATLLDVDVDAVSDWFWVAFVDAYDWVVQPNVLGMGTYGRGDLMTTKPYVAGSAYLNRMGDACASCALNPKTTCPITPMYWAFLDRHADALADNQRMSLPLGSLRKRSDAQRGQDRSTFERVRDALGRGERVDG